MLRFQTFDRFTFACCLSLLVFTAFSPMAAFAQDGKKPEEGKAAQAKPTDAKPGQMLPNWD